MFPVELENHLWCRSCYALQRMILELVLWKGSRGATGISWNEFRNGTKSNLKSCQPIVSKHLHRILYYELRVHCKWIRDSRSNNGRHTTKKSKKERKNVVFAECHKMFRIARNVERGQGHWPVPYAFLITIGQKLPGTGSSRKYSMGSFNNIIQTTVRLSFNDISILC